MPVSYTHLDVYKRQGYINFTDMVQKSIGEFADDFITSATISGNTLTVKTGSKILENYYSSYGPDEYFSPIFTTTAMSSR